MINAPIGNNELDRLKALLDYEILDTTSDPIYDEITKVASMICHVPIALISLVDSHRQWFKSKVGINADETPRDISFCGHAIHQTEVFIIENARVDERFKDNPLVIGPPHVIFYAGAPLTSASGHNIGTLCVIDSKPRKLTEDQIACLKLFSKVVVSYFEVKKQNNIIKILHNEITNSATKVHSSIENLASNLRYNSLVEMASGVAHEINNPLAIILGKTSIVLEMFKKSNIDKEKAVNNLESVCATVGRVVNIVKNLEIYSENTNKKNYLNNNLSKIINDSILFCEERINKLKVQIKLICSDVLELNCSPIKITQCLVNLISNSLDAIEKLNEKWIIINVEEEVEKISIFITDSGKGIHDPEILNRLMQPFFSTKDTGKGVGLGLSIVKGIVSEHNGEFFFNKDFDNTQFVMRFPKLKS